jgi:hypothetical protein
MILSIMTRVKMKISLVVLRIMILSMTKISIMTRVKMKISLVVLRIMILSMTKISIIILSIAKFCLSLRIIIV